MLLLRFFLQYEGGKYVKHSIEVPKAETLEELGTKVAQLRYDAILVFLKAFIRETTRQREQDAMKGYMQMALLGSHFTSSLATCLHFLQQMFFISARHMREDIKQQPLPLHTDTH